MRRRLGLCAALLLPVAAQASFGGGSCQDFACTFGTIGLILGAAGGIPVSCVIFISLHMFFAHPARSQRRQVLLGALNGVIAFEVFAVAASFALLWEKAHPGHASWITLAGPVALFLLMAAGSFYYVRSAPR